MMRFLTPLLALLLVQGSFAQLCSHGVAPCMDGPTGTRPQAFTGAAKDMLALQVVRSLPSPTPTPGDICFGGPFLYVGDADANKIFKVDTVSGAVVDQITTTLTRIGGLAHDGTHLWATPSDVLGGVSHILRIDPVTHAAVDSFPLFGGSFLHGMAFHDGALWLNVFHSGTFDSTLVLDFNGNVLQRMSNGFLYSHGITFVGNEPWLSANDLGNPYALIFRFDPVSYTPVDTLPVPGGNYPNGIEWYSDRLWVAELQSDSIYILDLDVNVGIDNTEAATDKVFNAWVIDGQLMVDGPSVHTLVLFDQAGKEVGRMPHRQGRTHRLSGMSRGIYVVQGIGAGSARYSRRVRVQ